jgi:hypothetical protein
VTVTTRLAFGSPGGVLVAVSAGGTLVLLGVLVAGGGGGQINVLVGTIVLVSVITGSVLVTGTTLVPPLVGVPLAAPAGGGVPVTNLAPGVRKTLTQAGCVRMAGSTGSTASPGLVRKSLLGLMPDCILAGSFQFGEKTRARCPAQITHRNPSSRMRRTINQSWRSRRSLSGFVDAGFIDGFADCNYT